MNEVNTANVEGATAPAATFQSTQAADKSRSNAASLEFDEAKSFNAGLLLAWFGVIIAIAGTVFFYLLYNSAKNSISDKENSKNDIIAQINSSQFADVSAKADQVRSAVSVLVSAKLDAPSINVILPSIYQAIDKDVVLTTLSLSSDGKVAFSATTKSYLSAGQQLMTFKNYLVGKDKLFSTVDLVSMTADTARGNVPVTINAQVNSTAMTALAKASTASSSTAATASGSSTVSSSSTSMTSPSVSSSTTGGTDATN